jgi:hypothetical protein
MFTIRDLLWLTLVVALARGKPYQLTLKSHPA